MELQLRLIIILVCVITLVFFGEAVRRGKIMLHITFPWLFCLAITGVLAIFPPLIDQVARVLGVINSMNALFFLRVYFFEYCGIFQLCNDEQIAARNRPFDSRNSALRI